ncbi:short-chain dehydrogenase [Saccharothrix sp. NRRL B-16348]|uniref:SDR family NAD(P)-dependent oxidoreductase n=1 Tax=Saccharothrix sp. NRRL B-16348 TaxID=1415542 RepID=UPI0006AF207A|nr:SDR family oxidoreductase [Saccharothrix sp. NRRL B-16348]KOX18805.1 short-chain dehydrogenase [Saccharothrix sp. NRRL B-16348]
MGKLTGKAAVVTGASRGIGRTIAQRLAADGAEVAVHYSTGEAAADETVAAIRAAGGRAFAVRAELGVAGDVDTLMAGLEHGSAGLDILVNNAAAPPAGPIGTDTPERFDHLFAVNVKAPYFLIQRVLPLMREGGRIINVSSVATRVANPGQTSFAMGKAALETMTFTLASALGRRGITVNAVAPGATRTTDNAAVFEAPGLAEFITGQTALDRLGRADDVADVVAFLASDDARWITGQVLDASGGLHLGLRA